MPTFSKARACIVLGVVGCFLTGMLGRVAYLETYARQRIIRSADRQQHTTLTILGAAGLSIFDRWGNELAGTVQSQIVYVDPHFMFDRIQAGKYSADRMERDLRRIAEIVDGDRPADQIAKELIAAVKERPDKHYIKVADRQPERIGKEVMKLVTREKEEIPGVGLEPQCVRYYPMGSLAAHILGGVGEDGQGLDGLELKFQSELCGKDGFKRYEKDALRRPLSVEEGDYAPPVHGKHLVLTIDAYIQMMAEDELRAACEYWKAEGGEVVVMDPYTGEVLALANWPTFNPDDANAPRDLRRNSTLVSPYEPGSIFKPFIMGPALQNHVTRITEVWPTTAGPFMVGSRAVNDVHTNGFHFSTWDVIVKSSNQGMTMLSLRMGNQALYNAITPFGFGRRTGIELPGEDPGLVWPLKKWTSSDTPSVAQGYYVMVTPLQLARAFCVYANGGKLVNPQIVKGRLDTDGKLIERQRGPRFEDLPQVLDRPTVELMRRIMADVPIRGTGTAAGEQCRYWNIFGKTGTAHISSGHGYTGNLYNSSFLCGAPVENPKVVVAMTIHKPKSQHGREAFGGTVTAPAAGKLMSRVLAYMQVPMSPAPVLPPPEVIPLLFNFQQAAYTKRAVVAER